MLPRKHSHLQDEQSPLLHDLENDHQDERQLLEFSKDDISNPRAWPRWRKMMNIAVIASMSIVSPLASSMFTPGIDQIAESLKVERNSVIGCQTGFVVMLGIGPLILAPLSETFGRRPLYLICFAAFTLIQIPTALSKSLPLLITLRTIAGFFGSVAIANGGGSISDMYEPNERAGIFGVYLLGPLMGPTIGPLMGGIILSSLDWPWLFWIISMICGIVLITSSLFLKETYVPILLAHRKQELEKSNGGLYYFEAEDTRPLGIKLAQSVRRPLRILFTQPIVVIMATYQALIFATTYSLYTQFQPIYGDTGFGQSPGYGFNSLQIGLSYLAPGFGFLFAVVFLVPRIDTIYKYLTAKHNGIPQPEYRLPIANIGAFLIPVSLFAFAWLVEYHAHWFTTMIATFFYGVGQVTIFNSVQNYYVDSFESYAASAIAAGAFFRSLCGGVIPLFTPLLLEDYGVGWGISIFALVSVVLAPSPAVFYWYGKGLRERFAIEL